MTIHSEALNDTDLPGTDAQVIDFPGFDSKEVQHVEAIAKSLDRLRVVCTNIALVTLLCELDGAPHERICAALDDVTKAGLHALDVLSAR